MYQGISMDHLDPDDLDWDEGSSSVCNECGQSTEGCATVETPEGTWHTSCAADAGEIDYDY